MNTTEFPTTLLLDPGPENPFGSQARQRRRANFPPNPTDSRPSRLGESTGRPVYTNRGPRHLPQS